MPALHTLIAFFGVSLLLAITPGPDNLFVMIQSAQRGWRVGLAVVLGLCAGLVVHTAAVALGLATLFAASAASFTMLKFLGAAYLTWLAWQALNPNGNVGDTQRDEAWVNPDAQEAVVVPSLRRVRLWRMAGRGMVMNLTNPKVVVFFLAFLPQFADPARGAVAVQIMVFGVVFVLCTLMVFGAIACFSGIFGATWLRPARAQRWLNRAAGVVFLGMAVRLATVSR